MASECKSHNLISKKHTLTVWTELILFRVVTYMLMYGVSYGYRDSFGIQFLHLPTLTVSGYSPTIHSSTLGASLLSLTSRPVELRIFSTEICR